MKKVLFLSVFLSLVCILPLTFSNFSYAQTESKTYIVTANQAKVYSSPDLIGSDVISTLKHKDEIQIECEDGRAVEYGEGDFVFYLVTSLEQNGYILTDMVVSQNKFLTSIPNFNAQTNASATVFFLEDGEYIESEITLSKHQRFFLYEGFDSKSDFNAVAFVYENEVLYGYLETDKIDPDGVSPVIISVICLILAVLGIIFALLFMKKKGKKKVVTSKKK